MCCMTSKAAQTNRNHSWQQCPQSLRRLRLNRRKCLSYRISSGNETVLCTVTSSLFGLTTFSLLMLLWELSIDYFPPLSFFAVSPLGFLSPKVVGRRVTGPQPHIRNALVLTLFPWKSSFQCECKDLPDHGLHWSVWDFADEVVPCCSPETCLWLWRFGRDGTRSVSHQVQLVTVGTDSKWDLFHALQLTWGKLLQSPVLWARLL